MTPEGRKYPVQPFNDLVGQFRDIQPVFRTKVRGDDAPAAAQGHDGDPVPFGQGQG